MAACRPLDGGHPSGRATRENCSRMNERRWKWNLMRNLVGKVTQSGLHLLVKFAIVAVPARRDGLESSTLLKLLSRSGKTECAELQVIDWAFH